MTTNAQLNIEDGGGIIQRGEPFHFKYTITPPVYSQFITRGAELIHDVVNGVNYYHVDGNDEKIERIIQVDVSKFDKYLLYSNGRYYTFTDRLRRLIISDATVEEIQENGIVSDTLNGDIEIKRDMDYVGSMYDGHVYEYNIANFYEDLRTLRVNEK